MKKYICLLALFAITLGAKAQVVVQDESLDGIVYGKKKETPKAAPEKKKQAETPKTSTTPKANTTAPKTNTPTTKTPTTAPKTSDTPKAASETPKAPSDAPKADEATRKPDTERTEKPREEEKKANTKPKTETKTADGKYANRKRYNAKGYRIQVYTGGNKRADKQAAQQMQQKFKKKFPELASYVHFISPHWVCRVGDFPKRESAQRYITKIRRARIANEARIVQSNIFVAR